VSTFQKVFVIIAGTGLAATLVAPKAKTAQVIDAVFNGLTKWQGKSMGAAAN